jgi:RecB family exonuclease
LACPVKFKWTYLDGRGKWYIKSKSYYSFGTSLHNVLQRYHDEGDQGVQTTSEAIAALEESWIDAGYGSQDEMMQALAEGKEIVANYIEQAQTAPITNKTILIEKMLRMDLGSFVLQGRVDRVDEWEDGTLEIVDYKSGRSEVREEDIATDLAMTCYQLLLREHYPNRSVCASIYALRVGQKATVSLSPEELEAFRQDLIKLGEIILNLDPNELRPQVKELCHRCDFLPLCKRDRDFASDYSELLQQLATQEQEHQTSSPQN